VFSHSAAAMQITQGKKQSSASGAFFKCTPAPNFPPPPPTSKRAREPTLNFLFWSQFFLARRGGQINHFDAASEELKDPNARN